MKTIGFALADTILIIRLGGSASDGHRSLGGACRCLHRIARSCSQRICRFSSIHDYGMAGIYFAIHPRSHLDIYGTGVEILNRTSVKNNKWSVGVSFDSGMVSFDGFGLSGDDHTCSSEDVRPPQNPDDPEQPSDEENKKTPKRTRGADYKLPDDIGNWSHRHYLPVTFGLSLERRFNSWIGVETGVSYSYLHSDYEGYNMEVACHWHYLEIPFKANMYVYNSDKFSIYGSLGGKVSLPVYSDAKVQYKYESKTYMAGSLDTKPIWSAGFSIGVSYRVSKRLNLYVEPSLQYHFPQEYKVPNIWTYDEPWSFSIPIGIRFNW